MSDTAWPGPRGNYYDPPAPPFLTKPLIQAFESPVLIKTANYQLLNSDCGACCSHEGAAGGVTFTLPTIGLGFYFSFVCIAAQVLTIKAPAGVTLRNAATTSSAGGTFTASVVGNAMTLVAINNNTWVSLGSVGAWGST